MGVATVSPEKYRALVAQALPKLIETDRELEHFAEMLESLDRLDRKLTPEEKALEALLLKLIQLNIGALHPGAVAAERGCY